MRCTIAVFSTDSTGILGLQVLGVCEGKAAAQTHDALLKFGDATKVLN